MSALAIPKLLEFDAAALARFGVLTGTEALVPTTSVLPLGWPVLDRVLPDRGLPRGVGLFEGAEEEGERPHLGPMSRAEQLVLDYERTGVSLSDHPMKLLRPRLPKKLKASKDLLTMRSGARVSAAVFDAYHHVATTARLLLVHGKIQRSDDPKALRLPDPDAPQSVVYIVADGLEAIDRELPAMASMSRDLH